MKTCIWPGILTEKTFVVCVIEYKPGDRDRKQETTDYYVETIVLSAARVMLIFIWKIVKQRNPVLVTEISATVSLTLTLRSHTGD